MKRVTGIGGVFIKSEDPQRLRDWYKQHLGLDIQDWGGVSFQWHNENQSNENGATVWSVFDKSSKYFNPSESGFMINYRVDDLKALLSVLKKEGCQVMDEIEESEFGKFGWVMDPDDNKVELWEPPQGKIT
ncbi:VOC family protein [Shewanella sp. 202IG2-18]|uniref:VOC family protein n=1 Tax=Parashewanella hymeniacidonis TaxID=2807618 RepID=UPI001961E021|nr:VOC family protein [Parashewanella hymeniacidonis]MBM7071171.1 VOC family protein [Parashewanella hymeniacidonis]